MRRGRPKRQPRDPQTADAATRRRLALGIVGISILGIVLLSVFAIALSGSSRADTSRLVFSSVLPLLGTWVGTVLAFYFARENLQAATDSAIQTTENTLRLTGRETSMPVTAVMIPVASFVSYDLGAGQLLENVPLREVQQKMQDSGFHRLPIRNATDAVLLVIHDSTLTAFAESAGQTIVDLNQTIGGLLGHADLKDLVEAIGFVDEKATVAEARARMASIPKCNDIFVTANGQRDERATGWLTNSLLAGIR
jgi:hypothetical protein